MLNEFKSFLTKHGVVGMAIGVVIGGAVGKLVKALVDDWIMPIVGALTPSGEWRTATLNIANIKFGVGDFAGAVVDFTIVSFVVFFIAKNLIKDAPKAPEPATKKCNDCLETVLAAAKKCKFCGSNV